MFSNETKMLLNYRPLVLMFMSGTGIEWSELYIISFTMCYEYVYVLIGCENLEHYIDSHFK